MMRFRLFGLSCLAVCFSLGLLVDCGGATTPPPTVTPPLPTAKPPPPTPTSPPLDVQALVQERCTACDTLDRVTKADLDRAGWERTVDRMIGRGARLDYNERQVLIDYLSSRVAPALIPHTLGERESCLTCHQIGGALPLPEDHEGRAEDLCLTCHKAQ